MTQQELAILSIIVASLGFVVSLATLYFVHLIGPKIRTSIGPYIKAYHTDYNLGGAAGIYLPISFFNQSPRSAVVLKTALEIYMKSNDQKRYFMHWKHFSEFNADLNSWKFREIAYAIPVLGKSSTQKTALYFWSSDNDEKLNFDEGVYVFDFIYWMRGKNKPIREHHELVIDSKTAKKMREYRESKISTTINIMLDKEMELNKLLSPHESKQLIG